ncbi:Polyprenyl synthetase [Penicillium ucsense]|uniref:Polyprenyl synthetase n=1 Tax=Penicillium ucsense TaxID=2839758 RepID=A0A8J8WHR4_9EURO|nr:Polyprenyl synthetase [Penicillium ucsense]KAF7735018.1 Polyprenyl synthetase [Penicillium ucsense]
MTDRNTLITCLPSILTDLEAQLISSGVPGELVGKFISCAKYNVEGGKLNRACIVLSTGRLTSTQPLSTLETWHLSILGWLTEIFQAAYLIWDDIMDASEYRRGRPCWYRQEGIGLSAVNDACLIKSSIMVLLTHYFHDHPSRNKLEALFHEASFRTELGQLADMSTSDHYHLADMTIERYSFIAENKTAYYSFCLPVMLALHYLQMASPRTVEIAQSILLRMGGYFQIQDDYLDVFGDPKVTGKVGMDIRDNKCSWIAIKAFELCNSEQKAILSLCYGRAGVELEDRVKQLFRQLELQNVFRRVETAEEGRLEEQIEGIEAEHGGLKVALRSILKTISRRNK